MAMLLNGGAHPFYDSKEQDAEIKRKIIKGELNISRISCSESAKDLLFGLLNIYPSERLDANSALMHPWIKQLDKLGKGGLNGPGLYQLNQCENKTALVLKYLILLNYVKKKGRQENNLSILKSGDSVNIDMRDILHNDINSQSSPVTDRIRTHSGILGRYILPSNKRFPPLSRDRNSHQDNIYSKNMSQSNHRYSKPKISPEKQRISPDYNIKNIYQKDNTTVAQFSSLGRLKSPKLKYNNISRDKESIDITNSNKNKRGKTPLKIQKTEE